MFAIKMYNLFNVVKNRSQISDVSGNIPQVCILFTDVKVHQSKAIMNVLFHVQKKKKLKSSRLCMYVCCSLILG